MVSRDFRSNAQRDLKIFSVSVCTRAYMDSLPDMPVHGFLILAAQIPHVIYETCHPLPRLLRIADKITEDYFKYSQIYWDFYIQ
jgi:hypothetical protein